MDWKTECYEKHTISGFCKNCGTHFDIELYHAYEKGSRLSSISIVCEKCKFENRTNK